MALPEFTVLSDDGEIQENRHNGYGYWMYSPAPAAPLDEALPEVAKFGDFNEMPGIIDELIHSKKVLVNGAPGSGKSHLLRDLQTACVFNSIPTFVLAMHINSGKADGAANISPYLHDFTDRSRETGGGVVILDNVDIVGYKGRSRQRSRAIEYAETIEPVIQGLLNDSSTTVLGTAHDDEWREGRWTWQDPAIDEPAAAILDGFSTRIVFDGRMALEGLAHLLWTRNAARVEGEPTISIGQAAKIIRQLHESRRANFFHARHLDAELFLRDPNAAIAAIEHGRAVRRGRA
jgi:hypothetical protein